MEALRKLRLFYARTVLVVFIVSIMFFAVPSSWFSRNKTDHFRKWAKLFLRVAFFLSGIRIKVNGLGNLPDGPIVFASNHRSLMDTLAILTFMDRPFFVITEPLTAMPNFFIQRWVEVLGYVPIIRDKADQEQHKVGMAPNFVVPLCVERIQKGESLVIYPEAHHEKGSRLLRFKTGAVRAALEAGVPLVPAAITGSQNVITPEHFIIHPGDVHIYIGKPMDISGKGADRRLVRSLTNKLKEEIASLIPGRSR